MDIPQVIGSWKAELVNKITNQNFVPVVDDNNVFIGIITRKDVILYLANREMIEDTQTD